MTEGFQQDVGLEKECSPSLRAHQRFSWYSQGAFRELLSVYVFSYFSFGFEGRIWDLIELVPDHCLSFHFTSVGTETDGKGTSVNTETNFNG